MADSILKSWSSTYNSAVTLLTYWLNGYPIYAWGFYITISNEYAANISKVWLPLIRQPTSFYNPGDGYIPYPQDYDHEGESVGTLTLNAHTAPSGYNLGSLLGTSQINGDSVSYTGAYPPVYTGSLYEFDFGGYIPLGIGEQICFVLYSSHVGISGGLNTWTAVKWSTNTQAGAATPHIRMQYTYTGTPTGAWLYPLSSWAFGFQIVGSLVIPVPPGTPDDLTPFPPSCCSDTENDYFWQPGVWSGDDYTDPYWGSGYVATGGGRWGRNLVVAGNGKVYYEDYT